MASLQPIGRSLNSPTCAAPATVSGRNLTDLAVSQFPLLCLTPLTVSTVGKATGVVSASPDTGQQGAARVLRVWPNWPALAGKREQAGTVILLP